MTALSSPPPPAPVAVRCRRGSAGGQLSRRSNTLQYKYNHYNTLLGKEFVNDYIEKYGEEHVKKHLNAYVKETNKNKKFLLKNGKVL